MIRVFGALIVLGVALALMFIWPSGSARPAPAATPFCSVTLAETATTATATIVAGCSGPGFVFASYNGQHTPRFDLFDSVSAPPWTVSLPPCQWQIDFSFMPGTDQHRFVAGTVGGSVCPPPTTTTTTTLPIHPPTSTTTTTAEPQGGLAPPPPAPPPPAPAPLPSINTEQQQIAGAASGTTQGNG